MSTAASDVVEQALTFSRADGCVVLVQESSSTNLRWANNTLTTNGAMRGRAVSVISVVGESVGVRSATSADGLPELVRDGETGVLVTPGDPVALAEALAALRDAPERRAALGAAARADVGARLTTARMLAEVQALYDTLAPTQARRVVD